MSENKASELREFLNVAHGYFTEGQDGWAAIERVKQVVLPEPVTPKDWPDEPGVWWSCKHNKAVFATANEHVSNSHAYSGFVVLSDSGCFIFDSSHTFIGPLQVIVPEVSEPTPEVPTEYIELFCVGCGQSARLPKTGFDTVSIKPITGWTFPPPRCPECSQNTRPTKTRQRARA